MRGSRKPGRRLGSGLAIIILVASLLVWMGAIVTSNVVVNKDQMLEASMLEQCRYAALAGLQRGLFELATNTGIVLFTDPPQNPPPEIDDRLATDPKLRYKVQLLANGTPNTIKAPDGSDIPPGSVYVYSVGYIEGTTVYMSVSGFSALAVRAKPIFDFAALGDSQVTINDDTRVDAWDSTTGTYPGALPFDPANPATYSFGASLATNSAAQGALKVFGNTQVDGNLVVGPDASDPAAVIQMGGGVMLTGQQQVAPGTRRIPLWETTLDPNAATTSVTVPPGSSQTLSPGPYRDLKVGQQGATGRATVYLQPGEYYFDQGIDLGQADLMMEPGSLGPAVIYVGGDVLIGDQSRVNHDPATAPNARPSQVQLYFVNKNDALTIQGGSVAQFVAAGSTMSATVDSSELFGGIMAQDVTVQGSGSKLHYDLSLKGMPLNGQGRWALVGVKEKGGRGRGGNGGGNGGNGNGGNGNNGSSGGSTTGSTTASSTTGSSTGSTTGSSTGSTTGSSSTGGSTTGSSTTGSSTTGSSTTGSTTGSTS
ncbi:MAG: hypothetical protein AB1758_26755, partial [Candidatus Eremiobacterota bacterium]